MRRATINEILEELGLKELKELCSKYGLSNSEGRVSPLKQRLSQLNWDSEKKEELFRVFCENKRGTRTYSTAHIFKSNNLSLIGAEEIIERLKIFPSVVIEEGEIKEGFEEISQDNNKIKGIYKGYGYRLIIIGKDIIKEKKLISIPFSIFREEGFILINQINRRDVKKLRELLQEKIKIEKIHYAIPPGIRDEGADPEDYNGRARDLVGGLDIVEINGVFLKIGGDTNINSIHYRGQGDILQEREIRNKIRDGALMVGMRGLIRHNEILIEFEIKWDWLVILKVSGKNVSQRVIDEVVSQIYSKYTEVMIR